MVRMRLSETDEIAAELYLVPPARFVAARDQVARQAREAGHRELARELQALRRPALSAWLVNALARHRREQLQELFALGRDLRQAQTQLDAESLRRLPGRREELVASLLDRARAHAAEAGVRVTEAAVAEVGSTLLAGLVDLGAAAAVLSGQLARPMVHAGFGPLPQVETVGGPAGPDRRPADETGGWTAWPVGTAPADPRAAPPDPRAAPAPADEVDDWFAWPADDELSRRRQRSGAAPAAPTTPRPAGGTQWPPDSAEAPAAAEERPGDGTTRPAAAEERLGGGGERAGGGKERLRRAEAALAEAASAHWQREHDLAEAEAAMQEVADRQELLEQQRMQLRREKVAAEQDLAAARTAQLEALRRLTAARRAVEEAELD